MAQLNISVSSGLILQDFVRHFHVLLPEGTNATREGIQGCLDQLDLEPDGYQVGRTMVGPLTLFFNVQSQHSSSKCLKSVLVF